MSSTVLKNNIRYVVHVGVGNFHRAHQAEYFYRLNQLLDNEAWGILGVSLVPQDAALINRLKSQNYEYHLLKRAVNGDESIEKIDVIKDIIPAYSDSQRAIDCLASETTEIISFTITEGAYLFNQETNQLLLEHADLQHDINNPQESKTVFGYLRQALNQRRSSHGRGVTLMSCDNIQHNGQVLQQALLQFLAEVDNTLARWVAKEVTFPCTMVDRITPASSPENSKYLKENYNIDDVAPVICEEFSQWVIEDKFFLRIPNLYKVGVIFTKDASPFEDMKIKLLNGGHMCLAYLASFSGYHYVHDAIADKSLHDFVKTYMELDARPCLKGETGIDISDYIETLLLRFSNAAIKDEVERICSDGLSKLNNFLTPVTNAAIESGRSLDRLALIYAGYQLYLQRGIDDSEKHPLFEPQADQVLLQRCSTDINFLLDYLNINDDTNNFKNVIEQHISDIKNQGIMNTINKESMHNV